MLNITKGNEIPLRCTLTVDGEPFAVVNAADVAVYLQGTLKRHECAFQIDTSEGNVLYVDAPGTLPTGCYGVEVRGVMNGVAWRTYTENVMKITYATERGEEASVLPLSDAYDITMEVQLYKSPSSDAKIAEHNADENAHPYIQSLIPDVSGFATKEEMQEVEGKIPTLPEHIVTDGDYNHTDNNYTAAEKQKLAGLPEGMGEYYTRDEVKRLVDGIKSFESVVVDTLPVASAETEGKIYFVRRGFQEAAQSADQEPAGKTKAPAKGFSEEDADAVYKENIYDEYVTVGSGGGYYWEKIGSTEVDLTEYVKQSELETLKPRIKVLDVKYIGTALFLDLPEDVATLEDGELKWHCDTLVLTHVRNSSSVWNEVTKDWDDAFEEECMPDFLIFNTSELELDSMFVRHIPVRHLETGRIGVWDLNFRIRNSEGIPNLVSYINEESFAHTEVIGASDLDWLTSNNEWKLIGGGDLTRIELRKTGNVVQLSGAIKSSTWTVTSEIFRIPERFRPSRTVTWAQMGQQWFQTSEGRRAVSYFCQMKADGMFSIDKMNIGGEEVQYQAEKYLFINGMWVVD